MKLICGDCIQELPRLEGNSVDSIVTDPPYELGFMGKSWDNTGIAYNKDMWSEVLRVLKPGGHLLSFGGTRTYHRMAVAIEDAGFEVRDMIEWIYASGFPKSRRINLSPMFCQCAVAEHSGGSTNPSQPQGDHNNKVLAEHDDVPALSGVPHLKNEDVDSLGDYQQDYGSGDGQPQDILSHDQVPSPLPEYAQEHSRSSSPDDGQVSESSHTPSQAQHSDHPSNQGYSHQTVVYDEQIGTPSDHKSPSGGVYKADHKQRNLDNSYTKYTNGFPICQRCGKPNADGIGTALKPAHEPICMARKPLAEKTVAENVLKYGTGGIDIDISRVDKPEGDKSGWSKTGSKAGENRAMSGANYERDAKPDSAKRFPANLIHDGSEEVVGLFPNESSRFFYCAKASKADRDEGLEQHEDKILAMSGGAAAAAARGEEYDNGDSGMNQTKVRKNNHPTVKPTALMRYLCKLVTRPGGTVLDPFMGSGSTGKAAKLEGFDFIGIEKEDEYMKIAEARIGATQHQEQLHLNN